MSRLHNFLDPNPTRPSPPIHISDAGEGGYLAYDGINCLRMMKLDFARTVSYETDQFQMNVSKRLLAVLGYTMATRS